MKEEKKLLETYQKVMVPNYLPADFIPKTAKGSRVWDFNDKEYIDLGGGIAVNSLGHANDELIEVLSAQSKKLWHLSNFVASEEAIKLVEKLTDNTFADKVFFCNSGSEANEAAIKIVRKFHSSINQDKTEIISFNNSFHGRSILNITLGGSEDSGKEFSPLIKGIKHAIFNDINSVKNLISERTAAIIIEPIQGETGIVEANKEFLKEIKSLCDSNSISLIFDEVQSGVGRTGHLYAYMKYEIEPDILTSAKGLGGGFPIGATLVSDNLAQTLQPGTHGSTFGGNHLACAATLAVIETLKEEKLMHHALQMETYFRNQAQNLKGLKAIKGRGLMLGLEFDFPIAILRKRLIFEHHIFTGSAKNPNVIRILPPLNIQKTHIDQLINALKTLL